MFERRETDADIAAELGRSERSVANKRHALGLRHYRRPTRPRPEATGWVRRSEHMQRALETALHAADAGAPHDEIAADIRRALIDAPQP